MQAHLGIIAALSAFIIWGSSPVYWKQLAMVAPMEILCHRMLWSLVLTAALTCFFKRWNIVITQLKNSTNLKVFFGSSVLMAGNWTLYIWAINKGYVVECSLGYFINPLMNICCGFFFFGERMRRVQIAAISIAFCAVIYLTIYYGQFPWIALTLAISFAIYAVVHKKTTVSALDSLCIETLLLALPAFVFLLWREYTGSGSFFSEGPQVTLLLMGAGFFTTIPLLCFGYAAHKLTLSTLGLIQYTAPSLSLFIGVFIYGEDFSTVRIIGFVLIWFALFLYIIEGLYFSRQQKKRILSTPSY